LVKETFPKSTQLINLCEEVFLNHDTILETLGDKDSLKDELGLTSKIAPKTWKFLQKQDEKLSGD